MSVLDPKADAAAIAPEIDKSVAALIQAMQQLLPSALNGLQIVVVSDDGTPVVTAKKIIIKITEGIK